jgi:surface antigen
MTGAASLAVLTGCASLDNSAAARVAAPLRDGIIAGELGQDLPERARNRAVETEYKALEGGLTGAPVEWRSGDIQGTVTPQQPYSVGSINCRRYTHTITQDGRARSATGTACRREDGSWRPLS